MNKTNETRSITILLVEDNPGDVRLIQEIFRDGKIFNKLDIARDGEEALNYLYQRGAFQNAPRPDLILLDLNLPKKNGDEVLAEIKADENLRRIPVIILTISTAEEDIVRAYNHYVNCNLRKPIDLNQFITVVQQIKSFWLSIVELPKSMAYE